MKISVPDGAVATNTGFLIQPNTCTLAEDENDRQAFRLLPEGSVFAKPVTVTFPYAAHNWNGSSEDLLTVLYQKADGPFRRVCSRRWQQQDHLFLTR